MLKLVALGHTNAEISEQLYLSVRTVESHRAHIQQKAGPLHAGRARRLRPRARTARAVRRRVAPSGGRGATLRRATDARPRPPDLRWPAMKILIAYDGSPDAKAAVALAGHLFDGSTAVVLTVWEGFSEVVQPGERRPVLHV